MNNADAIAFAPLYGHSVCRPISTDLAIYAATSVWYVYNSTTVLA